MTIKVEVVLRLGKQVFHIIELCIGTVNTYNTYIPSHEGSRQVNFFHSQLYILSLGSLQTGIYSFILAKHILNVPIH